MRKRLFAMGLCVVIVGAGVAFAGTQVDPDPAVNNPDEQAWGLMLAVSARAASKGNNNALFETWASDGDTFRPNPTWPSHPSPILRGRRALSLIAAEAHARVTPLVAPGGEDLISEETRRNQPDFNFIVSNRLFKVSGLVAAYKAGKPLAFPIESVEVKANWVEVSRLHEFNGFGGTPAEAEKIYHVNSANGKKFALVSFHVISKLVPNWTWATFEHKDNLGRCDVIGCADKFGALPQDVAPQSSTESRMKYPNCEKSPALLALLAKADIDPAFSNYCLKGSQSDFTDSTGLATRLGNSVTEQGFVAQSSCMSCHGRAAFDSQGHATTFAGFSPVGVFLKATENAGSAPVGPIRPEWFWSAPTSAPTFFAGVTGESGLQRTGMPSDFVWSIPFCAIDDTASPPETKSRFCSRK